MTSLPTITRTALANGKFHYTQDGAVHTDKSNRLYTHASVYRNEHGKVITFLHSRADLAAKGNTDANRICRANGRWSRIPGVVVIVDGDTTPDLGDTLTAAAVARATGIDARAFRAWMRRRGIGGRRFADARAAHAAVALFTADTNRR